MDIRGAREKAEELGRKLTKKQRDFVEYYLKCGNGTEAAACAGYSAKSAASQGSKLLSNPDVVDLLAAREQQLYAEMGINEGWVGRRYAEIVERCMAGSPHMVWNPETRQKEPDGYWLFDAKGAVAALKELAGSIGMTGGDVAQSVEIIVRNGSGEYAV